MQRHQVIRILATMLFVCTAASVFCGKIEERPHWSFQPAIRPPVPSLRGISTPSSLVDAFVGMRLSELGLVPNPPATQRELIRRAYFDLIGLPPSMEEVAAFERDSSDDAFEKVLDRLLGSPHYGERWGRHWLDLVRFAQSNGYERDGEKFLAWRYRDYVINAFNQDTPYDRFVMEQLAGDELPDATAASVVATGFQRLGVFDDEPDDKRMAEFDALDDVLATTGTTFLGLTLGCARCHDHKFDPILQSDYYSLLAFFRGVRHFESTAPDIDSPGFAPLAPPNEIKSWRAWKTAQLARLRAQLDSTADDHKRKAIEAEIKKVRKDVPYEWTLAVREAGHECPATHILARGDAAKPGREVKPAFLKCLTTEIPNVKEPPADSPTSGRRRVLARWIASADNPLTSRVMVNRIWQHHFGQGLVKTTSDFGRAGAMPSHPELLDFLASFFVENGWSVKRMHKLIMLSATYRQSSAAQNTKALALDPGNAFLWRQTLRRLEAETLRDNLLAISGSLNTSMAGRGFFPHLGGEVLAGQSRPGLDWDVSTSAEQSRRSVYAFVRRTMGVPLFESFDYNNTTSPLAERPVTTVAPQALMLLNDAFPQEQSSIFAARILREAAADPPSQVTRAYQLAFNRSPSAAELKTALGFFDRNTKAFAALAARHTFKLDVPNALSTEYFAKLSAEQFLFGPREGWRYYRGEWAPPYEGIRVAQREQAPFALWNQAGFENGAIEADLLFSSSSEFAGLLFPAQPVGESARGYELVLLPRESRVELRRHDTQDGKAHTLAHRTAQLPIGAAFHIRIARAGSRVAVWLGDTSTPSLEFEDKNHIKGAGYFGVRTWGGPLVLENIELTTGSNPSLQHPPPDRKSADRRALESLCLLLLNLNETIYID